MQASDSSRSDGPTRAAAARPDRAIMRALFLLVWFSCAWMGSWEGNPNNAVRMFAAISLVEDGDATIDEFADLTIDKARFGEHFYLDKAPGMTLMALPAVAAARLVTGERSGEVRRAGGDAGLWRFVLTRQWLAAATGPALLTALAAALLFDLGVGATGSRAAGLAGALAYALGSPIWGWSTTVFGHSTVAAMFVVAIWAVWRGTADARTRTGYAAVAGAALGWAVVVEYQAVLAGSAIGAWALWRLWGRADRWRLAGVAAAAGVAALVPMILYNLVAFGTVFRLGYEGVVGFEGMDRGLFGLTWPSPWVLWEITVLPKRGLFWVAPALAFGALGLLALRGRRGARDLAAVAAAVALVVLMVNAAYVYWDGGNSTGPRHAMPAAGPLALGVAALWAARTASYERAWMAVVLAGSIALNFVIAAADVMVSPAYEWPVSDVAWRMRFAQGGVRTVGNEYCGLSGWEGAALWVAVAVPAIWWLSKRAGEADRPVEGRVHG